MLRFLPTKCGVYTYKNGRPSTTFATIYMSRARHCLSQCLRKHAVPTTILLQTFSFHPQMQGRYNLPFDIVGEGQWRIVPSDQLPEYQEDPNGYIDREVAAGRWAPLQDKDLVLCKTEVFRAPDGMTLWQRATGHFRSHIKQGETAKRGLLMQYLHGSLQGTGLR